MLLIFYVLRYYLENYWQNESIFNCGVGIPGVADIELPLIRGFASVFNIHAILSRL